MSMPDSQAKRKWMKENSVNLTLKLMRRTETDIFDYLEKMEAKGIGKGTMFKIALREYMVNHPAEKD